MELQDYWRTIRRRWRLVLGSVLVVLAIAAVWTWSVTPLYSSSTRLFVSTSQTDENSAYTGNLFATQRVASYADLVTSNQLAERVADELGDTDAMDLRDVVDAMLYIAQNWLAVAPTPEVVWSKSPRRGRLGCDRSDAPD